MVGHIARLGVSACVWSVVSTRSRQDIDMLNISLHILNFRFEDTQATCVTRVQPSARVPDVGAWHSNQHNVLSPSLRMHYLERVHA